MIKFSGVSFSYDREGPPALKNIDLEVRIGESVAVVGPSGSGKTTLLMLMGALLLSGSGTVTVGGIPVSDGSQLWDVRRKVGLIFQNPDNQLVSTTVERELAFGMENIGLPSHEIAERIEDIMARFRLKEMRERPPHRLSGGEKQRVAIAAVLAMSPTYLALDEPTSLLDPEGRREFWSVLEELAEEKTRAIIHVTQFPEEVLLSRRVIVLKAGRLVYDGTPLELFDSRDDLAKWGLKRPAAMDLADRLRGFGYDIPRAAVTLDQLVDSLVGASRRDGSR